MLKSLFIGVYPVLALAGIVVSVVLFSNENMLAAIGLALISIPFVFFLAKLFLTDVARTDQHLTIYSIVIGIGILVLLYSYYVEHNHSALAFGTLLCLCWPLYLRWYSTFGDRTNNLLKEGQKFPSTNFEDVDGKALNTDSLIGKKNIFLFYRGNWCPLCTAQIKELARDYQTLEAKGIRTVLISPQSHKHTKHIAKKHKVGFTFLVDKNNSGAKQLNILSENGLPMGLQVLGYDSDTVMPTIILTDEEGKIIHADLTSNYRVRPEPSALMKYFEE